MHGPSTQGEALEALAARGFRLVLCKPKLLRFEGELHCRELAISASLEMTDWNFLTYPVIRLRDRLEQFPDILPHVGAAGGVCYFGEGRVVLDRYNPAGSLLCCLEQAEAVLTRMIFDPAGRQRDIQDEFSAYWASGQSASLGLVLIGEMDSATSTADYYTLSTEKGAFLSIASQKAAEVRAIFMVLGYQQQPVVTGRCSLWETDKYPAAPATLPKTVREVLAWIKQWDPRLYKGILGFLEKDVAYLDQNYVSISIRAPVGWVGFVFPMNAYRQACCRKATDRRRGAKAYKQYLLGSGGDTAIERPAFSEIGQKFIHGRNLRHQDLRDKKIVLIGCGAVGGYVAHALVKLGAGSGPKGQLTLVDNGLLMPENIGRHLLGTESLLTAKSEGVKRLLETQFPLAKIVSCTGDVSGNMSLLTSCDLVIDATGEEAINEFLNSHHMRNRDGFAPHLYVWVRGNGECVQSLWVDDPQYGCYRCLRHPPGPNYMQERFELGLPAPVGGFVGCRAFTPYAVSAPLSAASLATDAIIAWLQGDPGPRFRTRYIEDTPARRLKNQNIPPITGCPACRAN